MTDDDIDGLARHLVAAGLLVIGADDEGRETWALTDEGARIGRMLAMGSSDAEDVLDVLLGSAPS